MIHLHIDIETYSSVDLKKSGLYKYVQSPDFQILLFAFAYGDDAVIVVDLAQGEKLPERVVADLKNPNVVKWAHNAAFEIFSISRFYETNIYQWRCTMFYALYCGYPAGLAAVGSAMNFSADKKKQSIGGTLIRYFCIPCKPTNANGNRLRNLPKHDTGKWNLFKEYCRGDVVTEREVHTQLSKYVIPESEWGLWYTDLKINYYGVKVDTVLIAGSLAISNQMTEELSAKARNITGLDNPNSVAQLKEWVQANADMEIESLNKQTVAELLTDKAGNTELRTVLKIRQEMAKTSIKKYVAMDHAMCADGRVRGLLQFYGANRTGRWAGRLVQVQNLPRNYLASLDTARELVKDQKIEAIKMIYGNVPDTLSQLIRTAFIPSDGHYLAVADYSAIEARVIAWLAGEQWRIDVFNTHGKIYEASASTMFGVPLEKISKGNPEYELRAKGKVAELALGYQGAKGALIQMGALAMGLAEDDLPDIVRRWRDSNKRIVDLWYSVERAALDTVEKGTTNTLPCGITFTRDASCLFITLPSGRQLFYQEPSLTLNDWGNNSIIYTGMNQTTKKWESIPTYGGKLTENIVQAVARDCLAYAITNLEKYGYKIAFHVHDEVVLDVPLDNKSQSLEDAIEKMCILPPWATGLPLNADGFTGTYYKKE